MSFLLQSVTRLFAPRKPPLQQDEDDLPPRLRAVVTSRYPSIPRHLDLAEVPSSTVPPHHTHQDPTHSHPKLFRSYSSFTVSAEFSDLLSPSSPSLNQPPNDLDHGNDTNFPSDLDISNNVPTEPNTEIIPDNTIGPVSNDSNSTSTVLHETKNDSKSEYIQTDMHQTENWLSEKDEIIQPTDDEPNFHIEKEINDNLIYGDNLSREMPGEEDLTKFGDYNFEERPSPSTVIEEVDYIQTGKKPIPSIINEEEDFIKKEEKPSPSIIDEEEKPIPSIINEEVDFNEDKKKPSPSIINEEEKPIPLTIDEEVDFNEEKETLRPSIINEEEEKPSSTIVNEEDFSEKEEKSDPLIVNEGNDFSLKEKKSDSLTVNEGNDFSQKETTNLPASSPHSADSADGQPNANEFQTEESMLSENIKGSEEQLMPKKHIITLSSSERVSSVMDLVMIHRSPQVVFFACGDTTEIWLQRPPQPPVTLFFVESGDQKPNLGRTIPVLPNNVHVQHIKTCLSESPKWDSELVICGFDWLLPSTWVIDLVEAYPHLSSYDDFDAYLRAVHGLTNPQSTVIVVYQSHENESISTTVQSANTNDVTFSQVDFKCFVNKRSFQVLNDRQIVDSDECDVRVAALVHTTNVDGDVLEDIEAKTAEEPDTTEEEVTAEMDEVGSKEDATLKTFNFQLSVDSIPKEKREWGSCVIVIGSIERLGSWQGEFAQKMEGDIHENGGTLRKDVDVELDHLPFEYKFAIINDANKIVAWEEGTNRVHHDKSETSEVYELCESWRS